MRSVPTWLRVIVALAALVVVGGVLSLIPSRKVALAPHAPIDLRERLTVEGKRPEPLHGHIYMVGVSEREISLLQNWLLKLDDKVSIESAASGKTRSVELTRDQAAIKQSKKVAAAVAFRLTGLPVRISGKGAFIEAVDPKGPAAGKLQSGDRITAVNGKPVSIAPDATRLIGRAAPDTTLQLTVRRDNRPAAVSVRTQAVVDGAPEQRSRIGVQITTSQLRIDLPRKVAFDTDEVIGPSAGLAFALALYDTESEVDLLRGRYVVATGSLSLEGQVVPVGGARQKAIAAQAAGHDLILVPTANVEEAVKAVRQFCPNTRQCVRVLPVATVAGAVLDLQASSSVLEKKLAN